MYQCQKEGKSKVYCLLVQITKAKDKKALQPYAWIKDPLKDFFYLMIGIPMMAVLFSPMECLNFAPGHSKDLGRTFDNSLEYTRILMGMPVDQLKCVPHHSAADAEKRSP